MHPLQEVTIADALRLAQRALQVGDFRKSIAILEKVLAAQPLLTRARFSLGVAALRCNDTARAVAELRRALVLRPLIGCGVAHAGTSQL
jgi:lipopolysaccharide biosynthesis regulator YciM